MEGGQGNDRIFGYGGDDFIFDVEGQNYLDGGDGDDIIIGTGELVGGKGNDQLCATNSLLPLLLQLEGNPQGDIIHFNLGDGQDVIYHDLSIMGEMAEDYHYLNEEALASGMEFPEGKIIFGADVTSDMISCTRDGDNLVIKVGNEGDQMTITDYFRGGIYQTLNNLEFADGSTLRVENLVRTRSQTFAASPIMMSEVSTYGVDALISAMAAFDVPAGASQTSLNAQHQQVLTPVLAAAV